MAKWNIRLSLSGLLFNWEMESYIDYLRRLLQYRHRAIESVTALTKMADKAKFVTLREKTAQNVPKRYAVLRRVLYVSPCKSGKPVENEDLFLLEVCGIEIAYK